MSQKEQGTIFQLLLGPHCWFTAYEGLDLGLGLRVSLLQGGLSLVVRLQAGMDLSQPFYTPIP